MYRERHRQQGVTVMGWIVILLIVGLFALTAIKLFPMYFQFFQVRDILHDVAADKEIDLNNRQAVWVTIGKRLDISQITGIKSEHLKIERDKGRVILTLKYEDRRPYLGNLDIVGKFEETVEAVR